MPHVTKNIFYSLVSVLMLILVSSCGKRTYISNHELLRKALDAAAGDTSSGWTDAQRFASQAVEQNPKDVNARIVFALALEQCGRAKAAEAEAKVAAELGPASFMAQYTYGRILYNHDRLQDCIVSLQNALKLKQNDLDTVVLLANASVAIGSETSAITYFAILAGSSRFKNKIAPWNELGVIFTKKGDIKRAVKYFVHAYKINPDSPQVVLNLGILLDKHMKKEKKAYRYYAKYIKLVAKNHERAGKREKIIQRMQEIKSAQ